METAQKTKTDDFKLAAQKMTAAQILAIPEDQPERIFGAPDKNLIKDIYRALAKQWHSDRNPAPEAADVFKHVGDLYTTAKRRTENGTWHNPNELLINTLNGKKYKIRYLKKHDFELGDFYISNSLVTYRVKKEYGDLFKNGIQQIKSLRYANDTMREKTSRYMPEIHSVLETADHHILTIKKTDDMVLAADVLAHCGGKIEAKSTAWMVSRMHNLTSYLQWAGLAHNNIDINTIFVSPQHHSVCLLGGWWYTRKQGEELIGLPNQTLASAPRDVLDKGLADKATDHALLRATSRQLLGDRTGVRLVRDSEIPKPMVDWLCVPGSGDAYEDYRLWLDKIVIESFGERRFHPFKLTPQHIYQPA